jgi:hypothetical protein
VLKQSPERFYYVLEQMIGIVCEAKQLVAAPSGNAESIDALVTAESLSSRGPVSCGVSAVEKVQFLMLQLAMYESEAQLKDTIAHGIDYDTPAETMRTYIITWESQPYMDDDALGEMRRRKKVEEDVEEMLKQQGQARALDRQDARAAMQRDASRGRE